MLSKYINNCTLIFYVAAGKYQIMSEITHGNCTGVHDVISCHVYTTGLNDVLDWKNSRLEMILD